MLSRQSISVAWITQAKRHHGNALLCPSNAKQCGCGLHRAHTHGDEEETGGDRDNDGDADTTVAGDWHGNGKDSRHEGGSQFIGRKAVSECVR